MFAEGEISRMGSTLPFRRGLKRIVKNRNAPIVPVHLDRVYGSFGSSQQGRLRLLPDRIPMPVTVSFGAPMSNDTLPADVRVEVERLSEVAARCARRAQAAARRLRAPRHGGRLGGNVSRTRRARSCRAAPRWQALW